jgi:glutathione S-transferase
VEGFPRLHHAMTSFFATGGVRDYVRSDRRCRTWTIRGATFAGKPEETHQFTD